MDALGTAHERIARFERLGGVDLAHVAPEQRDLLTAEIHVGTAHYKKAIFQFRCPICNRHERSDTEMPPACTGPTWKDEHPLEPMEPIV